jgi:hypothetical protein
MSNKIKCYREEGENKKAKGAGIMDLEPEVL